MISFKLSEEQKTLQEKFHKIAESQLRPLSLEIEQRTPGPIDPCFSRLLAKEGLNSFIIPREFGGKPADGITLAIIIEELAWGCLDFASIFQANIHAMKTILIGGAKEQKAEFLPLMLSPTGAVASFCPTEDKSGSDSSSFSTTARLKKGRYILSGKKNPVINAGHSLFYIVWANMENDQGRSGINAFIVPGGSQGITCGPYYDKCGYRGVPMAMVSLDQVEVPKKNLIGPSGSGYLLLMQTVDWGRAFAGASCVGLARAAIEEALEFAKSRIIKKRPIISNQGVGFILAELVTQLEAARLLVWKACKLMDAGMDYTAASSMAKLFASELAVRASSEGMLILGQQSLYRSSLMGKFQRDAQLTRIVEGTSQIQKAIIVSQL